MKESNVVQERSDSPAQSGDGDAPALEVRQVSKRFESSRSGDVVALDDVSLKIKPGTFVSLVGPSGCGKTTLMMIMAGLEHPTQGQIFINGQESEGPSNNIGIVFQEPVLLPWKTVLDNVLLPAKIRKVMSRDIKARGQQLIDTVGLKGFEKHLPHELSGGMQQRNSIARALLLDPSTLLMDEPFGALDALTRERMNMELSNIWEKQRKAAVFVTHSISEAVFLSDEVVVMSARPGRIIRKISIDLGRPRTPAVMASSEFGDYTDEVRTLLEENA